ncbi:nitrate assimilation regulatory protein nirA [Apiospora kogelbergensis]|uniref:Nitrate assimilation regulatory protein nirA n=1 Tax=Apiospora kogelbergensis TaxID=1337665 RepID=A0AAW0QR88_9PEZI
MFDRWAAPLSSVLLDGIAQRLLHGYLYRPATVQATTDHPRPPQLAQLHQTDESGFNNMAHKRLAPRPAYESTYPKLTQPPKPTQPPKIACGCCRSGKTRSSVDSYKSLLDLLLETPEENVVQVLRDAQAAPDLQRHLAEARENTSTLQGRRQPSDLGATASLDFPTRSDLDYDKFTARFEIVYPAFTPIEPTAVSYQPRFTSHASKPDLSHPILNFEAPMSSSPAALSKTRHDSTDLFVGLTATLTERLCPSCPLVGAPTSGPGTPRSYVDKRLHRLQIGYWTCVPIRDEIAAIAISTYLEIDHPSHALFDTNLFLDDLVNQNTNFCSPFLVTSLLSHACYTCSAIDLQMSAFGSAFFKEAETLYKAERMSDCFSDSSALAIFSMVCELQCRNELAFETQQLSRQIGKRMKLFGVADKESNLTHFHHMPPKMKLATAQTAWGLYNWLSLHAFFYKDKAIEYPPIMPVPDDEWRRETLSSLGWPQHSLLPSMGRAFSALCTLCVLAQEIAAVYFSDREKPSQVSLAFAESKYSKLLELEATLGSELLRREKDTPMDTLTFHMYLHTIILTLFRPFFQSPQGDQRLRFVSAEATPSAIYTASVTQMKNIVLQHHIDHHGKLFPTFAYVGYMQLCSAIIGMSKNTETQRQENRSYFDVCMCFFQDATLQHAIAMPIAQGLLQMALESGLIKDSEMCEVVRCLKERGKHHCPPLETSNTSSSSFVSTTHQTHIIVNFELAVVDFRAAQAHTLASKLEEQMLFNEFTMATDDESSLQT